MQLRAAMKTRVFVMIDGHLWNLSHGYPGVEMSGWLPGVGQVSARSTVFIDCRAHNAN